jgi:F0F1-type ATP synthase membrane subunit b/b'
LKLNPQEEPIFQEEIDRMGLAEQEQVMEIVTTCMERGMERGAERETALVLRQLARQIKTVSPSLEEKVRQLSIEQVEVLGEALFDFSSETDLVNWLASFQN